MTSKDKDLREQKAQPRLTPDINDVTFSGDENRKVMPGSGKLVTPDPSNVPEGQTTKG